jgi:uncharacterized RDD family membrane protein YckC
VNSNFVDLRATVGRVLGVLGVLCAVVGIFVINGISIEFPGIMLAGLGYYFCLTAGDRMGQTIGILAAALNVVSMGISGFEHPQPWLNSHGVERP